MGDAQGQGGIEQYTVFLDENHCRNPHLLRVLSVAGVPVHKHLDCFPPGTEDTVWLPAIAQNGWVLLTADARIKRNYLERKAVEDNKIRMFYFSRNNMSGDEMGKALKSALPKMLAVLKTEVPPFAAAITRSGDVVVRERFLRV